MSLPLHSPRHELLKTRLRVASKWAIGVVVLEAHARYERNVLSAKTSGTARKRFEVIVEVIKKILPKKFFFFFFTPRFFYFLGTCSVFAERVTIIEEQNLHYLQTNAF